MATRRQAKPQVEWIGGDASTELSANRTAMSFDRTGLSSDRTLMAVIRTSLALIGFGFTIFQFFHKLNAKYLDLPDGAPRRFGFALILLGVILLALGIGDHWKETRVRRARRNRMVAQGLVHNVEPVKASSALVIAILLLLVGLFAMLRVGLSAGPF